MICALRLWPEFIQTMSLKQQINVLKLIMITKPIGDELFKIPTCSEFSAFVQVIFLLLTETTNIYVRL